MSKPKSYRNSGKEWTPTDVKKLKDGVAGNKPTGLIAWDLKRTKPAVYSKASELGISLDPTNRSPYNRRKK